VVHRCIYIANLWLLQLFLPWTVTVRYINSDLEHSRPLSCNCRVPARMVGPGRCLCPRASPKREGRRIDRESGCGWDNGGRQKNPRLWGEVSRGCAPPVTTVRPYQGPRQITAAALRRRALGVARVTMLTSKSRAMRI
jgi:hypothetical protein